MKIRGERATLVAMDCRCWIIGVVRSVRLESRGGAVVVIQQRPLRYLNLGV